MPLTYKTNWVESDFLSHTDTNRIESNTDQVATMLRNIGYSVPVISVYTARTRNYIDYLYDINRIEDNIEILKASFLTPPGYGGNKYWTIENTLDFNDMNRLESNIKILEEYVNSVFQSFRYCGAVNAGGGGLY